MNVMTVYQTFWSPLRWQLMLLAMFLPQVGMSHDGHEGGHSVELFALATVLVAGVVLWRRKTNTVLPRN